MGRDYSTVTEITGTRLTREGVAMMHTRYRFATEHASGSDVLEVACGAGQGLGGLQRLARRVVGGDCTFDLLRGALEHYGPRVGLLCMDAQALPFRDSSFDVAILYEAVYYLPRPERFFAEARRVLRPGGKLLVCSANPDWSEFNPSPHSVRYYSPAGMEDLIRAAGFTTRTFVAYPSASPSRSARVVAALRRFAVRFHLMPSTMKGKEALKRLFYGKLEAMPPELNLQGVPAESPRPLDAGMAGGDYKVYFVTGIAP